MIRAGVFCVLLALVRGAAAAPLTDGPEFAARDGVLTATLEAREMKTVLDGVEIDTIVYNGDFAGPVLRVWPGDTMRIRLLNRLNEPTNLHFHGMQTSPRGNSDNIHIAVPPGQDFDYEVKIPAFQPPGAYWYHAHLHGLSEKQVGRGLSGALIVEGFKERIPGLGGVKERLLSFKTIVIEDSDNPIVNESWHGEARTVNGHLTIDMTMRPGETILWHIANHDANQAIHLALAGHRFTVVGMDGAAIPGAIEREVLDIGPASRLEVLVTAGAAGDYPLMARNVLTGQGASLSRDRILGRVTVAGAAAAPSTAALPPVADLSALPVTGYRTFVFSQSRDAAHYYINGRKFDPARIDTRVNLGDVEDWTIRNDSDDMHAFHIHQLPFQVMAENGAPVPFQGLRDTYPVPERGSIEIRLAFRNPDIVGTFMYHCHVLNHEDRGMMQTIEVIDPRAARPDTGEVRFGASRFGRFAALFSLTGRNDGFVAPICRAVERFSGVDGRAMP